MRLVAALLVALDLALGAGAAPARAETIRIVLPFAPGGALDPLARILANGLTKLRSADSIVIENIGGAGGIVGMSTVAKAAPDGRTLLFSPSGSIVISPSLQGNLPYDTAFAFEPVALVGSVKSALIVRASLRRSSRSSGSGRSESSRLKAGRHPKTIVHFAAQICCNQKLAAQPNVRSR
jgi:tripartite-type tricarboxylate transporter receptor subunit TctC